MNKSCAGFLEEWEDYLKQQNHKTEKGGADRYWHILRSKDERGIPYLWIITCHQGSVKRFSDSELRLLDSIEKYRDSGRFKIFAF